MAATYFIRNGFLCVFTILLASSIVMAQANPSQQESAANDSVPMVRMNGVVVTANRAAGILSNSTQSTSLLLRSDVDIFPVKTFSEALPLVPGFSFIDRDGQGSDVSLMNRGFYGGGEAEYVQVLVNGRAVNDLESGLVEWSTLPLSAIERVEVVRGGMSPLYGDVALGGIINIITQENPIAQYSSLSVRAGSYGKYSIGGTTNGTVGEIPYRLFGSSDRLEGYRNHSEWRGTTLGADIGLWHNASSQLNLSSLNSWSLRDEPGPLTADEIAIDRTISSPYYRYDDRDERRNLTQLNFVHALSPQHSVLDASVGYSYRGGERTRTFLNPTPIIDPQTFEITGLYDTTFFGDTKKRSLGAHRWNGNVQLTLTPSSEQIPLRFIAGIEGSYGCMSSAYLQTFSGFEEAYRQGGVIVPGAVTDGDSRRTQYAGYISADFYPISVLTVTLGGRYDVLRDRYEGKMPNSDVVTASNSAFSPKGGMNLRYLQLENIQGNLYLSVSRSFKAPTMDQLTDQRPLSAGAFMPIGNDEFAFVPLGIPPFSNRDLKPQRSTNFEAGIYQSFSINRELKIEVSSSFYTIDLTDEIDFDFATYRYQNIIESRHRGIETGMRFSRGSELTSFANYSLTNATFSDGPLSGNHLKAIPQHTFVLGIAVSPSSMLAASLLWSFANNIYLDDANTTQLSDFHFGNAKVSATFKPVRLSFSVENILDRSFATTGYILYGSTYLYPHAGRTFSIGADVTF